jgi:type VI secretion system secreted protein VgrG
MPPYALTGNKTQSGWKTRSTTGGGSSDFNELRFEDKKGQEEVYFHAEKDFTRVVENNDSLKVGLDKKSPGKQDIEIWGTRTTTIKQGDDNLTLNMGSKSTKVDLGSITYEAMQKIELKVGMSKITIDMAQIKLEAPMITLQATGLAKVQAPVTMVQGTGVMQVQGGVTMVTGTPCIVSGPPLLLG